MPRRELNNANAVKRMTDFLGHSNNFATLSLSLSLICANRQSTTFNNIRACARQYTAFHAKSNGKPLCFYAMPLAKATFSATQIQLRK
jgi:hypothetical protein